MEMSRELQESVYCSRAAVLCIADTLITQIGEIEGGGVGGRRKRLDGWRKNFHFQHCRWKPKSRPSFIKRNQSIPKETEALDTNDLCAKNRRVKKTSFTHYLRQEMIGTVI